MHIMLSGAVKNKRKIKGKKMKKLIKLTALFITTALLFVSCNKKAAEQVSVAKSVVALSPAATEILFAIGAEDQIAAVSEYSDYPEAAKEKPVVGGFDGNTLSMEKILSFKPDLVYLTEGMHNFLIQGLEDNNIPYYISNATSVQAVYEEISDIGKLTGHENQAAIVIAEMKRIATGMQATDSEKTSVYYEVWNEPYMSIGNTSFINDIIINAGGKNIFDDLSDGYPVVSEETIIARQPEVILIPANSGISADSVKARAGWENIPAVKNNKVYVIDDNLYSRPGSRVANGISELSVLLSK